MSTKLRGALEMSVAMTISGTIGWVVMHSGQPLVDLIFWRCVFGGLTLLVTCLAMNLLSQGQGVCLRNLLLAALGGVALVTNWLLIFASYSHASISIATVVYNTQPFMLVGLGVLLLSERLSALKIFWLCLSFVGLILLAQAKHSGSLQNGSYLLGVLMALGAAFCYAVAAFIAKKLKEEMAPQLIALIQVGVGIIMMAPFVTWGRLPTGAQVWGTHIAMGVVYTGLVFILLYGAVQRLPTTTAGALSFILPVVAIGVDYIAFDQRLTLGQMVGGVAILLAAAGMTFGWSLPGLSPRRVEPDKCGAGHR